MERLTKSIGIGIVFFLPLLFAACGDEELVEVEREPAIQVAVSATPESLDTGEMVTVQATVTRGADRALSLRWKALGGTFVDAEAESTSWIAPDDPDLYTLSVVATDGDEVGIGKADVWVATYVAADEPHYLGAEACGLCHSGGSGGDQYTTWSETNHAHAVETLAEIGQDNNSRCLGCHTVGTYGWLADVNLDNGGFDETAVERLHGVQCENCHGPGSQHPNVEFTSVEATLSDTLCGQCHTDEHHPTWDEWLESPHNDVYAYPAGRASCAKCHNGLHAAEYLNDPEGFMDPSEDPEVVIDITCAVCHDPHGNDNPGQLRDASVTDRALPSAILVEAAGAGRLCMSCHNGRRSSEDVDEQITDGDDHFGPHHAVQGDMLAGVNANEDVDPTFSFASSKHILVEDACVTCHTTRVEEELPYFTGHTFEPTTSACAPCHGAISDFADIMAKEDYDGDGAVEAVQEEVEGLLDTLKVAIIEASTSEAAQDSLENAEDFSEPLGNASITTADQRKAGYNWAFVEFDQSKGVHNTTYAIQLLQRSILFLDSEKLGKAYLLTEAN